MEFKRHKWPLEKLKFIYLFISVEFSSWIEAIQLDDWCVDDCYSDFSFRKDLRWWNCPMSNPPFLPKNPFETSTHEIRPESKRERTFTIFYVLLISIFPDVICFWCEWIDKSIETHRNSLFSSHPNLRIIISSLCSLCVPSHCWLVSTFDLDFQLSINIQIHCAPLHNALSLSQKKNLNHILEICGIYNNVVIQPAATNDGGGDNAGTDDDNDTGSIRFDWWLQFNSFYDYYLSCNRCSLCVYTLHTITFTISARNCVWHAYRCSCSFLLPFRLRLIWCERTSVCVVFSDKF